MKKVVLVTGASRGIGEAIVKNILALDSNAVVYGIARNEDALKSLKDTVGARFQYLAGDITDEDKINELVEKVVLEQGRIDSIVANAGVLEPVAKVGSSSVAEWKKLYDINFFSIIHLINKTLPHLEKSEGNAIFVSSGASTKPYYGWCAYGSSKAAVNHLTMSLAAENKAIKTIAVAPGVVDTKMQDDIRDKFGPSGMTADALKRFTDLKKNGELLDADVLGKIYARLAVSGIPAELNGEYVRYNDSRLQ